MWGGEIHKKAISIRNPSHFLQYRFSRGENSLYLVCEFYVCFSVGSKSPGNRVTGSENIFNSFISHIKQVWTFTFHRRAAVVEDFYKDTTLEFTIKKFNRQQLLTHLTPSRENHINFERTTWNCLNFIWITGG